MEGITARIPAKFTDERIRLWKKWLPTLLAIVILTTVFCCEGLIVRHNTEQRVRAEMAAEYDAKLEAYKAEQAAEAQAQYFLSGDASREAAINQEADAIARAIGPMKTRRMKLTMLWNILARVDNKAYPDSVADVIGQPDQWMFYDPKNPIHDDDRALALEQLELWHDGRYPSGLTTNHVYGEWSANDYVLRNTWEKSSKTDYWRMPE